VTGARSAPLAERVRAGDRAALARAITLVESTRPDHREDAQALLDSVVESTGGATRIGVTGAPGAGKSTFIEALGAHVTSGGKRLAVLAVDPSSARSGGSILGDKTRMEDLARDPNAFIRPSPSGGTAGGVARRTREAMLLCEAAGFDTVLVETVGVGQAEVAVADMVDVFCLLASPGAGDDLQGIKRGVMELADVVAVTKADGDLLGPARQTAADLRLALHLIQPKHDGWLPPVLLCSALRGEGIAEVWDAIADLAAKLQSSGALDERRAEQAVAWLWSEVDERLRADLRADARVARLLPALEAQVRAGTTTPATAAAAIVGAFTDRVEEVHP
jgi:LAO/AO transport system kinase